MRKLILTLASIAMMGCATIPNANSNLESSNEAFRKLGIPARFENYRAKRFEKRLVETNGNLIGVKDYFLSKSKKPYVREVYKIYGQDSSTGEYLSTDIPFGYAFDLNGNKKFGDDEILMDDRKDGLNGNERWQVMKIVKFGNDIL
jgi:hypothetical protein